MKSKYVLYLLCLFLIGDFDAVAQRRALGVRSVQETLKQQNTIVEEKKQDKTEAVVYVNKKLPQETQTLPFISDVDINIPQTIDVRDNTFVVIIANENYTDVEKVPYALRDGELVRTYCINALGIPESNIHYVADATLNNIKKQVRWLSEIVHVYEGKAKIIFYYSGHGIPDDKSKDAYILPVDGYGSDYETGYSLKELYEALGKLSAESVFVFLDACFSGSMRDGGMLASARGVAIKSKPSKPVGNMIIFSAAQGDETALPYKEKQHGMFTYFLLKKIQEKKGNVMLGELEEYIVGEVKKHSVVINQKMQTPTISSSATLSTIWKNMKL